MNTKITIRDVAAKAGVSISSVHFALSGKPGVSEETRKKIRQIAMEIGYQPNALASNLKRSTQKIAILLPSAEGNNQYYYPTVWNGVHDYLSKVTANLSCMELPYFEHNKADILQQVKRLVQTDELDGILTVGHVDDMATEEIWNYICRQNVSIVCISSENKRCDFLCCVLPEYDVIGRTMAELIVSHITDYGSILLCAGNPKWDSHSLVARGFESYLRENKHSNLVYKDYSWEIKNANYVDIYNQLSRPDIAACCSVYSQGTIMLGQALEESGKAGKIYAVGSDLTAATSNRLRCGIFQNVIQKNPYAQGYVGIRTLVEYLTSGRQPEQKHVYVGSEVILKSNLVMYEQERYRHLFL